jgi:hypothetical protein
MAKRNKPQLMEAEQLLGAGFVGCRVSSLKLDERQSSMLISYSGQASIECGDNSFSIEFVRLKSSSKGAVSDYARMPLESGNGSVSVQLFNYLSADGQTACRTLNLNYIDAAGNAWITLPGLHVDRQGFKPTRASGYGVDSRNVFSDKSTLILRLLMPGEQMGVREISRRLSEDGFPISPGYVTKVLQVLDRERYSRAQAGLYSLANRRELLDDWAADYKRRNRPTRTGLYLPARSIDEVVKKVGKAIGKKAVLSGHAGASLIDPFAAFDSVQVLTKEPDTTISALLNLGVKPVERGANIQVFAPRYKVSAFYSARLVSGIMVASNLQLYLDLLCQPIRGLEAAEHLYNRFIAPMIDEDTDDDK